MNYLWSFIYLKQWTELETASKTVSKNNLVVSSVTQASQLSIKVYNHFYSSRQSEPGKYVNHHKGHGRDVCVALLLATVNG